MGHVCIALMMVTAALCLVDPFALADDAGASPSPFRLRVDAGSASHFLVGWTDAIDNETGYRVRRRRTGGPWVDLGAVPAGTTTFESVGCLASTAYEHQVIAVLKDGGTAESRVVSAKTDEADATMRGTLVYDPHARQGDGSLIKVDGIIYSIHQVTPGGGHDKSEAHIVLMYSRDNGQSWSKEQDLFEEEEYHNKHPAVLVLPDGRIAAAYTRYDGGSQGGRWSAHRAFRIFPKRGSERGEVTPAKLADVDNWSRISRITDDSWIYQGGLHDRMRLLSDGSLITAVLASDGRKPRKIGTNIYKLDAQHLKDPAGKWERKTPQRIYVGDRSGFVESSIEEWDPKGYPGHLLCLGRTEKGRYYESRSTDFGETWSEPVPSAIRAPVAPPYLRRIPGTGKLVLIWNPYVDPAPTAKGTWHGGDRWILASMVSGDGGRSWHNYRQLEYDRDPRTWYAYANLLFDGERLHLAYRRWTDIPGKPKKGALIYRQLPIDWFTNHSKQ